MSKENFAGEKVALFYTEMWHCFDPFSAFTIEYKGRTWMTLEHAYQAARFIDEVIIEKIYRAPSPYMAKEIARQEKYNKDVLVSSWEDKKLQVMRELIHLKVEQHLYVKEKLLESKGLVIVEDSPTDAYWGRGEDWKGINNLGKLWMEERDGLNET